MQAEEQEFEKRAREILATGFVIGVQSCNSTLGTPTEDEVSRLVEMLKTGEVK